VQEDDNLLVWIHSLRNASEWGHARKMEQLETVLGTSNPPSPGISTQALL